MTKLKTKLCDQQEAAADREKNLQARIDELERFETVALARVNGLQQAIYGGKKREEHLRSALAHWKQRVRKDKKKFA